MTEQIFGMDSLPVRPHRAVGQAMWRGLLCRCPHCGEGTLFRAFVKPVDNCAVCGEDYTPQQADDFPAYITIAIVGHIVLGGFMAAETLVAWPNWLHMTIWPAMTVILSIALLQPIKGSVIGLQWANYMHGFSGETDDTDLSEE
jgi:uncharacterized protein (DUF983 family)